MPVDKTCSETADGSGVFTRKWSKAEISMNCNNYDGKIEMTAVTAPPPPPPPPPPCSGPTCFTFSPDWASGSAATTLPTANFSVRKLEAIVYPPDNKTYAYVDICNVRAAASSISFAQLSSR